MNEYPIPRPYPLAKSNTGLSLQTNWKAGSNWKLWLKLDYNSDEINQAISIEFDENDTIEDVKDKLFNRLNGTRWNRYNDMMSVGIGIYTNVPDLQENMTNLNTSDKILSHSPSSLKEQILQTNNNRSPQNSPLDRQNYRTRWLANHRRSNSASPTFQSIPNNRITPILNSNWHSEYHNEQLSSLYSHPKYASPNPHVSRQSPRKNLKYSVEDIDDYHYKIIFDPDEQIYQIYVSLFGAIGSQTSSSALLVFSNVDMGHAPPLPMESPAAGIFDDDHDKFAGHIQVLSQEHSVGNMDTYDNDNSLHGFGSNNADEVNFYANGTDIDERSNSELQAVQPAMLLLPKDYRLEEQEQLYHESEHNSNEKNKGLAFISDRNSSASVPQLENDKSKQLHVDTNVLDKQNAIDSNNYKQANSLLLSPLDVLKTTETTPIPVSKEKQQNITALDTLPFKLTTTSEKVFPKINVLIVEDNVINQAILGSFLRKNKISYKIAKNGKEAVDKWKEGNLHLIFMDLQLPVLSGIEAAKKIRELEKERGIANQSERVSTPGSLSSINMNGSTNSPVIIVALTASNSQEDKREALISGCNDYLTKPVNLLWLSKKITEWGCMQALIDFDGWKKEASRMTDSVLVRSPHRNRIPSANKSSTSISRSSSSGGKKQERALSINN
ncbi:Response regulatory domain profile [Nakaseomyces glabratus]|nr:Response regulatory domain profile [Nakaseomyces glabratus]KAH7596628.1 Response regulatory domain profile [Nakaseomyces glabratus]